MGHRQQLQQRGPSAKDLDVTVSSDASSQGKHRTTLGASEIEGTFIQGGSGGGGIGGASGAGGETEESSSTKLHFLFLHACEEGDVEHVHTLLSMFGGKELDVNVRKAIASPEDAAQQDDDDAAAGESDGIRRQQHFNTFNISTRRTTSDDFKVGEVTGLFLASISENEDGGEEIVFLLKENGAEVDVPLQPEGYTPLFIAVMRGKERMVRVLLENGAAADKKVGGSTPFFLGAKIGVGRPILRILLKFCPSLVHVPHDDGRTPIFVAAMCGHRDAVEVCIDAGAQVNEPVDGLTPLLIACYKGHVSVVERLLETGQADVNMCALDGTTPLFIAAHRGRTNLVQLLLAKNAKVNLQHNDGRTPLFVAAQFGHAEVVELLIAYGADVNHTLPDGYTTPLYVATLEGHTEVMDLLLGAGAIVSVDEDELLEYPEEQVQVQQPKKGALKKATSARSFGKSKVEKAREASIEISGPTNFKKLSATGPASAQQEVSKVVVQIEETRKRRIKAFIRADLTFKSLMERGKAASASPEDAQRVQTLYSKYRDIYLPILHPAVEKPIQLDPKDVRADADWAEEEGVKRAYTEAQRLREEMRPLHEIRALLTHEHRPVLGTLISAPVTFRSKSPDELLRLFKDQQTVDHWRRVIEAIHPLPAPAITPPSGSRILPPRPQAPPPSPEELARMKQEVQEELARLDEKEKEVRKQQQNVVDFGAFCEEVVKRATNYFNIERLVTTHRKLAQDKRQELVKAVHQELEEELQMKKKRIVEEAERQKREEEEAAAAALDSTFVPPPPPSVQSSPRAGPPLPPPRSSRAPLPERLAEQQHNSDNRYGDAEEEEEQQQDSRSKRQSVWVPGGARQRQRRSIMTRMMMRRSIQLTNVPGTPPFTTANPPPMWSRMPSLGSNRTATSHNPEDPASADVEQQPAPSDDNAGYHYGDEQQSQEQEQQHEHGAEYPEEEVEQVEAYPEYDPETEYAYHYDDEAFEDVDLKEAELW